MNIVLDQSVEEVSANEKNEIGMVVRNELYVLYIVPNTNVVFAGHSRQQCGDDGAFRTSVTHYNATTTIILS